MKKTETISLLWEITHCPIALGCLENPTDSHYCTRIVKSQEAKTFKEFQLSEPWNGDLERARILFLSSNPSISTKLAIKKREKYPDGSWSEEKIIDFFEHRFGGGDTMWVKNGLHHLCRDETYSKDWVRYWAATRKLASELLKRDAQPGNDYALSEVVHCKSKGEIGVEDALNTCTKRYLRRVIEVSGARVIVCLGRIAKKSVREFFQMPDETRQFGPVQLGQKERYFTFLPHPNARTTRSFAGCLAPNELLTLQELVSMY